MPIQALFRVRVIHFLTTASRQAPQWKATLQPVPQRRPAVETYLKYLLLLMGIKARVTVK
jgi:hypothetical protein